MRRKVIALLLVLSAVSIMIAGCGNNEPAAESSVVSEPVYETPEGYATYTLSGYDFDCLESWGEPIEAEDSPAMGFQPFEGKFDTILISINTPDTYDFYTEGMSLDEDFLEKAACSSLTKSLDESHISSATPFDTPYGLHCIMYAGSDDDDNMFYEYAAILDNYVLKVFLGTGEKDQDALNALTTATMQIADSVRPHE